MAEKALTRQVRLAAMQVAALEEGELAYALAYELEPESGIKPSDAETTWREVPGDDPTVKVYEVTVRRRSASAAAGGEGPVRSRWMTRAIWAAAVAAVIAAIGVAVDYLALSRRIASLERTVARQMPLDAELRRLAAEERRAADEARTLAAARESREVAALRADRCRAAYAGLLDALASVLGSNRSAAIVRTIESPAPFTVAISAVALSPSVAADVLADLTGAAAEKGWRLSPGEIAAAPDGLTCSFSFSLAFSAE